jgi:hypothetical protein
VSRAAVVAGVLWISGTGALAAGASPYRVAVEVSYGQDVAPTSLREDIARLTLDTLRARGCFEGVESRSATDPAADLLLRVRLSDVRDETNYDDSLAGHIDPNDPEARLRYTVSLSVAVATELVSLPEETVVQSKRFHVRAERRPAFQGEDPRVEARSEVVASVARRVASVACDVPRKKIEAARSRTRSER